VIFRLSGIDLQVTIGLLPKKLLTATFSPSGNWVSPLPGSIIPIGHFGSSILTFFVSLGYNWLDPNQLRSPSLERLKNAVFHIFQ
jgi:hypothetical protein